MTYEKTPFSNKPSDNAIKKEVNAQLDKFSTKRMLWHVVKRHKFALSITANVLFVLGWAIPAWPQIIKSFL